MNPFSFKITPILCLEIAWENSTAAAKRAGKFSVYNQKGQSLFSGPCLGPPLKKAESRLYPYRCHKFALAHTTRPEAGKTAADSPNASCLITDTGEGLRGYSSQDTTVSPCTWPEAANQFLCCRFEGKGLSSFHKHRRQD